ncbi:MAG: hypothetical protein H0U70_07170 [Tatlockia sp.]|nr:hypothetical protein [Tatlockia sp.]
MAKNQEQAHKLNKNDSKKTEERAWGAMEQLTHLRYFNSNKHGVTIYRLIQLATYRFQTSLLFEQNATILI